MKAIFFEKSGSAEVLQYGDVTAPGSCEDGQVLVRLKAIGINPTDGKLRSAPECFPVSFPVIPGCDGAGIVEAVGHQVKILSQAMKFFSHNLVSISARVLMSNMC